MQSLNYYSYSLFANLVSSVSYLFVFLSRSTQEHIFEVGVKEIVESVLGGYNGSIIASGQTGSGKTFTIEGTEVNQGIIPRAASMIFERKLKNMSIWVHCGRMGDENKHVLVDEYYLRRYCKLPQQERQVSGQNIVPGDLQ